MVSRAPATVPASRPPAEPREAEGDATAAYLAREIIPLGIRVTRLARGLPMGSDLEYADEVTLGRAFEGRRRIDA